MRHAHGLIAGVPHIGEQSPLSLVIHRYARLRVEDDGARRKERRGHATLRKERRGESTRGGEGGGGRGGYESEGQLSIEASVLQEKVPAEKIKKEEKIKCHHWGRERRVP